MTVADLVEHGFALLVAVVLPILGAVQHRKVQSGLEPVVVSSRDKILTYWSNSANLMILAGLAALIAVWAGRSLAELGLTAAPTKLAAGLLLAGGFVVAYALDTWYQLATPERLARTRARWRRDTPFMPASAREVAHATPLVITAAVGEEIVFRGFLVGYVLDLVGATTAGMAVAVAAPALVFGASHYYQGWRAMGKIVVLAAVFGAIYVVTGSLWIPIALHLAVDAVGMLLGPTLMASPSVVPLADPGLS